MKNSIIISVLLFLTSCGTNKIVAQQNTEKKDICFYLQQLDSLGADTTDFIYLFNLGYYVIYSGENDKGNTLMEYAMSNFKDINEKDYEKWSIRNTKNGNYIIAIDKLEKAMQINPEQISGYYGWVLLYYYRDYKKSLKILEQFDAYTPNFADAPMGEDIHYLKGLCHMQMKNYQKAIDEFNTYIKNLATHHGEEFVDVYTFVQKGRCLTQIGQFEEAIKSFEKAIRYYKDCTEAYYYMALTQVKMNKKEKACVNLNISLEMINRGEKNFDMYVELFHEIYPQQIEQAIEKYCK